MRLYALLAILTCCVGLAATARAETPTASKQPKNQPSDAVEVTADQSLEWYQEKRLYVARGKAKATRGTTIITADVLTAHEREKAKNAPKKTTDPGDKSSAGDIDLMTADGHVVITDPRQRITGDHAVYDLDKHKMIVTGSDLRYETAKEVVTATDSLEYYDDTKLAVARGHAIADQPGRHIEADVLTAEFSDAPGGQSQLSKMTARGHVSVITKSSDAGNGKTKGGDVSRGDRAVYNADSNVAVLSGHVRISRKDGTELSGDVGEVDFNKNENRLMNSGSGRVRALLPEKSTDKASQHP